MSTGYQEKPCLDPQDPECPLTAPNKNGQASAKFQNFLLEKI